MKEIKKILNQIIEKLDDLEINIYDLEKKLDHITEQVDPDIYHILGKLDDIIEQVKQE